MEGRYVGPPRAILPISSCEQTILISLPSAFLRGLTVTVYDGRFFGLDCFRMPNRWYVHGTGKRVKHCLMCGATPCFSHLLTSVLTLLALSGMSLSRCLDSSNFSVFSLMNHIPDATSNGRRPHNDSSLGCVISFLDFFRWGSVAFLNFPVFSALLRQETVFARFSLFAILLRKCVS